jgi:hypothetical protein
LVILEDEDNGKSNYAGDKSDKSPDLGVKNSPKNENYRNYTSNRHTSSINVETKSINSHTKSINVETKSIAGDTSSINIGRNSINDDTSSINVGQNSFNVDTLSGNVDTSSITFFSDGSVSIPERGKNNNESGNVEPKPYYLSSNTGNDDSSTLLPNSNNVIRSGLGGTGTSSTEVIRSLNDPIYTFNDLPVFRQGEVYTFALAAFEEYSNGKTGDDLIVDVVPVKGSKVSFGGELLMDTNPDAIELDTLGHGVFRFLGGMADLTTAIRSVSAMIQIDAFKNTSLH